MDPPRLLGKEPGTSRVPEEQSRGAGEPPVGQQPPQEMPEWMRPFMSQIQTLAAQVSELQAEKAARAEREARGFAPAPQLVQEPQVAQERAK